MGYRVLAATAAVLAVGVTACAGFGRGDRSDLVATPEICTHITVPIYFEESQAGLTAPAQELIRQGADALRRCTVDRVRVIGLASATGGAQANMSLSERRAVTVAEALVNAGLPAPAFEIEAAGEAGAREGGVSEPVRRRVEVVIEARPAS